MPMSVSDFPGVWPSGKKGGDWTFMLAFPTL